MRLTVLIVYFFKSIGHLINLDSIYKDVTPNFSFNGDSRGSPLNSPSTADRGTIINIYNIINNFHSSFIVAAINYFFPLCSTNVIIFFISKFFFFK